MKTPDASHPMTIAENPLRVRARFQDHVIADTALAMSVREGDAAPGQYFPRKDVETGFMSETDKQYTCPY